MRKTFGFLVALAASLTLPGAASAQTKIVIGIPTSPPNIVHMPPIVAKELGLYKKAGIDAEIVSLGDGTKVFRALLERRIIVRALKGYKLAEWVRISVGTMEQNRRCIAALKEILPSQRP